MIKVLHLINSMDSGGIENWLLSMLREIPRSRCAIDVCCKGVHVGKLASRVEQYGGKVLHCPLDFSHIGFMQRLRRILIEGQYNIIHNHLQTYSGLPVWIAHQVGIPIITTFHNVSFPAQTPLTQLPFIRHLRSVYSFLSIGYALRNSELVTGVSRSIINSLNSRAARLLRQPCPVHGVTIPNLATAEERASFRTGFGWGIDTPLILHVGNFKRQKNHIGLLDIFDRVLSRIPTAKLLLVGQGPLKSSIEETIAVRELASAVRLLGTRDDVPALMTKCDLLLFPSLYEGFGLVAIEANAAALPVVGTQVPGLTEAIADGTTGLLHAVHDIDGMADSVVSLLNDEGYARKLGMAGRTHVKENFSVAASAAGLLKLYQELLGQPFIQPTSRSEAA